MSKRHSSIVNTIRKYQQLTADSTSDMMASKRPGSILNDFSKTKKQREVVMEDAVTCGVCSEEYSAGAHDPLTLPCGHTFCRTCLVSVRKSTGLACPTCRKSHVVLTVENLSPNYTILNLSENFTSYQLEKCRKHGELLGFWCRKCCMAVCGLCIFQSHPQDGHDIVSSKVYVEEKKDAIKNVTVQLFKDSDMAKMATNKKFQHFALEMLNIFKKSTAIETFNKSLTKISNEVTKTSSIEAILIYEAKHQALQEKAATLRCPSACASDEDETTSNSDDGDATEDEIDEEELVELHESSSRASANEAIPSRSMCGPFNPGPSTSAGGGHRNSGSDDNSEAEALEPLVWPVRISVEHGKSRKSRLIWEDNELLMLPASTSDKHSEPHLSLHISLLKHLCQPNPEVFLELNVGTHYLGRVCLRLWITLPRAKHFMMLCEGSAGPSFLGSRFSYTHREGTREYLVGGEYKLEEGGSSTKGLLPNLGWAGHYTGKDREGLVVGFSGGDPELDSLYGICVSKDSREKCGCPFGEVVSGLEVVRRAAVQDNISDVYIKRCGVLYELVDEISDSQ